MLTLITGVPGSGKTAGAIDLILREFKDRPLFVDGLAGLTLEHLPLDVLKWPEDVPDGALIVVDEVQRKWRPRAPGSKVPPSVAALETHRHRGLDFILITQSPKLLDANVRALVGRHLHIRDTGFMGRWIYEWPECSIDLAWKSCENKRRYKLPHKVFSLYRSASMHTKAVRRVPPVVFGLVAAVAAVVGLGVVAWNVWGSKGAEAGASPETSVVASLQNLGSGKSAQEPTKAPVSNAPDEEIDFLPRMAGRPWTAPAYDKIRKVVVMPQIAGAICFKGECVCVSQVGTRMREISSKACQAWLENPPFNPYLEPVRVAAVASRPQSSDASQDQPRSLPVPDSFTNPRAEARWSSDERKPGP